MSFRPLLAGFVLVLLAGIAQATEDFPLVLPDASAWSVEKPDDEVDLFVLTGEAIPDAFFTLSRWPIAMETQDAASVVRDIADGVEGKTGWFWRLFGKGDGYETETLEGVVFSGEAALWRYWGDDVVVVFMVEDGKTGWNGQFSGTPEEWDAAKAMLAALRWSPDSVPDEDPTEPPTQ